MEATIFSVLKLKGLKHSCFKSVYRPCKEIKENTTEFMEVIDQLLYILYRYSVTHKVIIGGDMNEYLTSSSRQTE